MELKDIASLVIAIFALILSGFSYWSATKIHHDDVILQNWFQLLSLTEQVLPIAEAEGFRQKWKSQYEDTLNAIFAQSGNLTKINLKDRKDFLVYLSDSLIQQLPEIPRNESFHRTAWLLALSEIRNAAAPDQKPTLEKTLRGYLSDDQAILIDIQTLLWSDIDAFLFLSQTSIFGPVLNDKHSEPIVRRFNELPPPSPPPVAAK